MAMVMGAMSEVTGEEVREEDDLFDAGLSSLTAMKLREAPQAAFAHGSNDAPSRQLAHLVD